MAYNAGETATAHRNEWERKYIILHNKGYMMSYIQGALTDHPF